MEHRREARERRHEMGMRASVQAKAASTPAAVPRDMRSRRMPGPGQGTGSRDTLPAADQDCAAATSAYSSI